LNLKCDILVSKFAFKCNYLCRYALAFPTFSIELKKATNPVRSFTPSEEDDVWRGGFTCELWAVGGSHQAGSSSTAHSIVVVGLYTLHQVNP
jgi:hypothetical protein